jgi:hypothetical protein
LGVALRIDFLPFHGKNSGGFSGRDSNPAQRIKAFRNSGVALRI